MNAAVVRKSLREAAVLIVILTIAGVGFEIVFVRAMREFASDLTRVWFSRPMIRQLIGALVGADLAESVTPTGLVTVGLAHPLIYALTWTLLLSIGTRVIAGEVDRGTADLLMSLPVSRGSLYTSVSAAWMIASVVASFAPVVGIWIGQRVFPFWEPIEMSRLWLVAVNLLALDVGVSCVTLFVSTLVSRRGMAVAIALAGLLVSFLINFLVQLWPAVDRIGFLGLLHYYRPLAIVRSGALPWRDLFVLLGVALVAWLAGLWRFRRRDIPAA
ncbi:MAG TPA: ABC transporter permease [Phycisphaerae bacterium]